MNTVRVQTARGTFTIEPLTATFLVVCFGRHTGWYQGGDRPLYVGGHIVRQDVFGEWDWTDKHSRGPCVFTVSDDGERIQDEICNEPRYEGHLGFLLDEARRWLAAHPEYVAQLARNDMQKRISAARRDVERHRENLKNAEEYLAALEAERDALAETGATS